VAWCKAAMRHAQGMDWLGGYPTACHGAVFAAGNSMNLSVLATGAWRRSGTPSLFAVVCGARIFAGSSSCHVVRT
jgi:hypothetical protein